MKNILHVKSSFYFFKQEDNKTKQPLSNKAFNARSKHIQKSKTFPGIKCHYNYLSSNEIPLLILQGYNSDSKSYQKVENKSDTNKQQDKDNPFYSKYLAHECLGPTTSQVQIATEKQRERKVRTMFKILSKKSFKSLLNIFL